MMTLEYPIDVATLKTNGHITLEFLFTAKTTKNAGNISGQFESSYISNERSIITAYGEFSKTKSTEKMYALDSENRSFQDILSQNALSLNGASGNFSSTTKTIDTGTNITTSPNFLFVIVPFSADYQFAGKKVTDLDPSVASISARIVNSNTGTVAGAISSTSTSGNSLYAEIVNTSTTPIELVE